MAIVLGYVTGTFQLAGSIFVASWVLVITGFVLTFIAIAPEYSNAKITLAFRMCAIGLAVVSCAVLSTLVYPEGVTFDVVVKFGMLLFTAGIILLWVGMLRR